MGCSELLEHFPTKSEIIALEAGVIQSVIKQLAVQGTLRTQAELEKLGLVPVECLELVLLARCALGDQRELMDPVHDLELMDAALDEFLGRARESLNLSAEMQGLKLKSNIRGLTRNEVDDPILESVRIIGKVAAEQDQKRLTS